MLKPQALLPIVLTFITSSIAAASDFLVTGIVSDATDGEGLEFVTVFIKPTGRAVQTDAQGAFATNLPEGTYTLDVQFIGYKTTHYEVEVDKDIQLDIKLARADNTLKEVVITAEESMGMTSSSKIDRDAMSHLQPTSFTDLLELLPGNISQTPNMGSVNSITLRETGNLGATGTKVENSNYNISSLGTLFVVDGVPINGDANMQSIPGLDASSLGYGKDMTNKGVDMRTITTDNIESVEIVRGIPSAEYGNLTSGMVNIKRMKRAMPVIARLKVDEYSKLFSVGKGLYVKDHVLTFDVGYLDSKVDPRDNLEKYKRVTLSSRMDLTFPLKGMTIEWSPSIDYTGSFDNEKTDPDLSYNKVDEYKATYNMFNFGNDLKFQFNKEAIREVEFTFAASYQQDRLERHRQVAPQRASVAPTSMEEGVHDGQYLLTEYIADYVCDGKPLTLFGKLKLAGSWGIDNINNSYQAGVEWDMSKNYGKGQVYDLTKPLSASWTTRPRAYKDIPALNILSYYLEDNFSATLGDNIFNLQAGVRATQIVGLDHKYTINGKLYLDPRLNATWTFPDINIGGRSLRFIIAGGYGLATKMPTIDYLFPQNVYTDFTQLNYYDVNNPTEYSRVNLRTYINDVTNYDLRPARNRKWEVRLGVEYGGNRLSVTYFEEHMSSGFRYSAIYQPYSYRKYDASAIDASTLNGPPSLDNLPYTDVVELSGYNTVTNGSRIDKKGIEFQFNSMRIKPLCTSLIITGAWFHTRYSNSQMQYQSVSDVVDGAAVSNTYVGLYDSDDGRVNDQFNTNFMFDTQITRWGLIFSTSIQCMWWVKTTRLRENGVPAYYLSAIDGELHPYLPEDRNDKLLQFLVKTYSDAVYDTYKIPTAIYVNLKATKEIGKHLRIAVFVNRLIDFLPEYKSNGQVVRRSSNPYFGMELNFSI